MKKSIFILIFFLITLFFVSTFAHAGNAMTLSGYLYDSQNKILSAGVFEFKITLWNNRDADNALSAKANWEELHTVTFNPTDSGKFKIVIGSITAVSESMAGQYPYMQIEVRDAGKKKVFEILDPQPESDAIDRLDFSADTLFFSDNAFTIRRNNKLNNEVAIQFGDALAASIKYNLLADVFNISKTVNITGDLNVTGLINGRDLKADGVLFDKLSSVEKIVSAINASALKIKADNIDFGSSENTLVKRHVFDLSKAVVYAPAESLLFVADSKIIIKENDIVSIAADYLNGDRFANGPSQGVFSPADKLYYIAAPGALRVFGVDFTSNKIIHEIGLHGIGKGGIDGMNDVSVSGDGLLMAINSWRHYVSVWKRKSVQDDWQFAFDIGVPNQSGTVSDGSRLSSNRSVAIRNSDKHIFAGSYSGLIANAGGVSEYDSDGKFVSIPLYKGKYSKNGQIIYGEAQKVLNLRFDKNENLWVSSDDNEIGYFDAKTWQLKRTIISNDAAPHLIRKPYTMSVFGENQDKLLLFNSDSRHAQIWSQDGKLLDEFGYSRDSGYNISKPLGFSSLAGFAAGSSDDFYILDRNNNNIQKIAYSRAGKISYVLLPEATLKGVKKLSRLITNKSQTGAMNKIRFQYFFPQSNVWVDMPEDRDLSAIKITGDKIQIAAVFTPDLTTAAEFTGDIISGVQVEYSITD